MGRHGDDDALIWRLAKGDGEALDPLIQHWGDAVIETCFRALRDAARAADLSAETWAEMYLRIRYGTAPLPRAAFGPWAVGVIGDLIDIAAREGRIPDRARRRMRLTKVVPSSEELDRIAELRDPTTLHGARDRLPRDFSAAADRMLLEMPGPTAIAHIRPSLGDLP